MPHLFDNLLISSPNGGGLFFIHRDQVFHLDNLNTTGISLSGNTLLRGLQPQGLITYQGNQIEQRETPHIHDIHDVLVAESYFYAVGTTRNEVLQLNQQAEEVRRWTFDGEDDAKHLNCLALWNQRIVFCAFGDFTKHRQYKGNSAQAGFVQDLLSGERLITGLSQPHSLFSIGENLLLANSETKELHEYDSDGLILRSKTLDGYTRGIFVQDGKIYIGLSCSRNIESGDLASARLIALDSQSWRELGYIDLPASEIYSVHGIENPQLIPALLAGICQHVSSLYQGSKKEHEAKLQVLAQHNIQLEDLNTSLAAGLAAGQAEREQALQMLAERDVQLSTASLQYEASYHLQKQTRDKLDNVLSRLTERDEQLSTASQQYENSHHQHLQTFKQLDSTLALLSEREAQLLELGQQHEAYRQQRIETQLELDMTRARLAERDTEVETMGRQLQEARWQHEQLLSSNSWRLTQPMRTLRHWLKW